MELYPFQKDAVSALLNGKSIIYATMGAGKNPISMVWAAEKCKAVGKSKILVTTTASKARTSDHITDLASFVPEQDRVGVEAEVISWHKLARWVDEHRRKDLKDFVAVFDEVQRCGAGVSSGMGRAFLYFTRYNEDWAGFTGTPGDTWLKFYPYFTACGLVVGKTVFLHDFAIVQTYKGYPEIIGWRNEDRLRQMWDAISYAPDAQSVMRQLPRETHKVITFAKPSGYNKILKTRTNGEGEFLDTAGALCAELRRQCFTKDKQEWVKDFVLDLDAGCVFFYNFIATGDKLENIMAKALGKGGRVWRIDGKHHDVPTADTMGKKDMVLCQWQSGSEALNLQFLHYWCSVEACYSYSTSQQARGRIRRIGQAMPMQFYYLKTVGTIEDDIYKCLKEKGTFAEDVWCIENNLIKEE